MLQDLHKLSHQGRSFNLKREMLFQSYRYHITQNYCSFGSAIHLALPVRNGCLENRSRRVSNFGYSWLIDPQSNKGLSKIQGQLSNKTRKSD